MRYVYKSVERIPDQLRDGVVYHNEEFEIAALKCACGCGHRVTLLVPDSHQVTSQNGLPTIRPSIAVCDAACKSHYFITAGEVEWLSAFTDEQVTSLMHRQIARHAALDPKRQSWIARMKTALVRASNRILSFFGMNRR